MGTAERIKELRKHFKLNQQEFAEQIKMAKITVAKWETNASNLPTNTALLICQKFNVNYDWLVNGQGSMLDDKDETISSLKKEYPDITNQEIVILEKWLKLEHEDRMYLLGKLKYLFNDETEKKDTD